VTSYIPAVLGISTCYIPQISKITNTKGDYPFAPDQILIPFLGLLRDQSFSVLLILDLLELGLIIKNNADKKIAN
tara:strand:+ start:960 stop:1184 length:225 start_codon:yes stop_codon:yes gene_type:complete